MNQPPYFPPDDPVNVSASDALDLAEAEIARLKAELAAMEAKANSVANVFSKLSRDYDQAKDDDIWNAALDAAAEVAGRCADQRCAACDPDWQPMRPPTLAQAIDAKVRAAVAEERERCARIAENCLSALYCPPWVDAQRAIAAEIRGDVRPSSVGEYLVLSAEQVAVMKKALEFAESRCEWNAERDEVNAALAILDGAK